MMTIRYGRDWRGVKKSQMLQKMNGNGNRVDEVRAYVHLVRTVLTFIPMWPCDARREGGGEERPCGGPADHWPLTTGH